MSENSTGHFRLLAALARLLWARADAGLRRRFAATGALVIATTAFSALVPLAFKPLVDALASPHEAATALPALLIAAYVVAQWLGRVVSELRWAVYGRFEQQLQRQLALMTFDHVHALSLRFHLARRSGGLQQVMSNGLFGYRMVLSHGLFTVLPLVVELVLIGAVLVHFDTPVFAVTLALTTLLYVASFVVGVERQRAHQRRANDAYVDAFARAADSYFNYETIKYFNGESLVRSDLDRALAGGADGFSRFYVIRTFTGLIQAACLAIGLAAVVVTAAQATTTGAMSLGDFVLVNTYMLQLWRPLDNLAFAYREIRMAMTYLERLLELLAERSEITDAANAVALAPGPGEVVFRDVGFAYDRRRPVLEAITIRIPPGRTLAVVGPSGSGKSTLSRLLFRFYDLDTGTIAIDGQPLTGLTLASLRAAIAVVPQDTPLFNDSLTYNIAIGRPDVGRDEIERAARLAEIHDFIASLPDGYETVVGERGLKLSGGEKQRVAIARAVLKRPRIFVFDEATSALDSETERAIQRNLTALSRNTTTLIIAHRLSTIVHADEIVVLADGVIRERGRHDDLVAAGGIYAGMWRRQQTVAGREREADHV
jgi:ATP-binding cassette, subfamily B, heavy metal transporter